MRKDLEKVKEDAVAERNSHWEGVLKQKQQEHEDAVATKVRHRQYESTLERKCLNAPANRPARRQIQQHGGFFKFVFG